MVKVNFKNLVRLLIVSLLTSLFIYGTLNLYKMEFDEEYSKRYVSGVVTDKFESAYSCGKRQVCYNRYLVIDSNHEAVNIDTYLKSKEGSVVNLVYTEQVNNLTAFQVLSACFSFIVMLLLLAVLGVFFIKWLLED